MKVKAFPMELETHNLEDPCARSTTWVEVEEVRIPPNSVLDGGDTIDQESSKSSATRRGNQMLRLWRF